MPTDDATGEYVTPDGEAFLQAVRDILLTDSGIDIGYYKRRFLLRRIAVRERALGCGAHNEYLVKLRTTPKEISRCLEELTITVTEFFRDTEVFAYLGETLIPELMKKRLPSPAKPLRIWSAACASGEEAYSLAMLMEEAVERAPYASDYLIFATDVNFRALEIAIRGCYPKDKLANVPAELLSAYFSPYDGNGETLCVNPSLKGKVKFTTQDILLPFAEKNFDLILCRNVLMYFSSKLQNSILEKLMSCLNSDGYLALGQVERISGISQESFRAVSPNHHIYQKISTAEGQIV